MRFFILIFLLYSTCRSEELLVVKPVIDKLSDNTSLELFISGTAATLLTRPYDDRIRDEWKNHQQMSQSAADIGNFLGSGIAGVVIVGSQYFFDEQQNNWKNHGRALIWESVAVFAMKYSFGRQRPGNSSNYQSFPSGHTATAFATATSLTYSYGWKAAVLAYPIAGFVGASRWADDMHWGSDVVAGAFVGFIMARATQLGETDSKVATVSQVLPIISQDFSGINYIYSF